MPDDRYIILLNDALKDHILSLSARERGRLREKFEFLENGFWDAGVRVKKLKGTAGRVVFEARMNKGDRLLFTLGNHRGKTAIYVWGIASHDAISETAARIVPRNAPFLDFDPIEPEEREDLSIDTLPAHWRSQEDVEQKVPEDYGPQRWLVLDDTEWKRVLAAPGPGSFEAFLFLTREQEELLSAVPPVLLSGTAGSGKTTLSVYYLVRGASSATRKLFLTYNPLLKNLAERIYSGLMEKRDGAASVPHPRFLVFRDLLREITRGITADFPPDREVGLREFAQIFKDHKDRRKYDAELVWEEIRSIVKGSKLPLSPARYARLAERYIAGESPAAELSELREYLLGLQELSIARRAEAFIGRTTSFGNYAGFLHAMTRRNDEAARECAMVLEELLRLVENSASDFTSPLLSAEEYMALGKKRAPSFLYDRREIHAIAEFYQDRLARSGRWDEIDLSKAALRLLDGTAEEFSWDLVVCDEVQDLTDVQVSLLFRLAADPRAVVLTGDPRQIINPSGFRWEEVKNKLYERGLPVPPVHRLSLNFRCVGSIVRLSNALLDLKADLVGLSDTETREEWKFAGKPPLLLADLAEEEVLSRIDTRGAGQVILTRTGESRDRLKRALDTELVFTIAEAKGLEFDTVFLWGFCGDGEAESVWRAIRAGQAVEHARLPHVRYELALLYVAVTRARNTLIIYDGPSPSVIWEIGALAPLVFRAAEKEMLADLWRMISLPSEWETQGDYYLGHEHYAAARECFRNAGHEEKHALASALLLFRDGDFENAAPFFESGGDREKAADSFERAHQWSRALPLWKALGEKDREIRCSARVHEVAGDFSAAARKWESLGEAVQALENWEKAGAFDRVGRALAKAGQYERAAMLLEKAKLPLEAAACLVRIGREERAADLFFRAGDVRKAIRLYKKCGNQEKLLRCYRQLGDQLAIAAWHEARGEVRKAIEAFFRYAGQSEEHRREVVSSIPEAKTRSSALKAAIRYSSLDMPDKAGPLFLRAGQGAAAALEMEKAGDFLGLSRCLSGMGMYLDAARALEKTDMDPRSMTEELLRLLYLHFSADPEPDRKALANLHAEAMRMKSDGRLAPALARFKLMEDDDNIKELYLRLGLHEEAIRYFTATVNPAAALTYARSKGFAVSEAFIESFMEEHRTEFRRGDEEEALLRELFFEMFDVCFHDAPEPEPRRVLERFFAAAVGPYLNADYLPDIVFDLVIRYRVPNLIITIVRDNLEFQLSRSGRFHSFVDNLTRAAVETEDRDLSACAAYAVGQQAFEKAAEILVLSDRNVSVIALSLIRYRDAVAWLMAAGRVEQAELYCRINSDYGLAARYTEQRGDLKSAARYFMDARDHEGALRCFRALKDQRGEARALERLGRIAEAIAIWKKLDRKLDVSRLLKKYPLAGQDKK